jgi:hypothetical protein
MPKPFERDRLKYSLLPDTHSMDAHYIQTTVGPALTEALHNVMKHRPTPHDAINYIGNYLIHKHNLSLQLKHEQDVSNHLKEMKYAAEDDSKLKRLSLQKVAGEVAKKMREREIEREVLRIQREEEERIRAEQLKKEQDEAEKKKEADELMRKMAENGQNDLFVLHELEEPAVPAPSIENPTESTA